MTNLRSSIRDLVFTSFSFITSLSTLSAFAAPTLQDALIERGSVAIGESVDSNGEFNANFFTPYITHGVFEGVVDGKFYQVGKFSPLATDGSKLILRICAAVGGNARTNQFGYFDETNTFKPLLSAMDSLGATYEATQNQGEEWELGVHTLPTAFDPEMFGHSLDSENSTPSYPEGIPLIIAQKVTRDGLVHLPVADKNNSSYECAVKEGDVLLFIEDLLPPPHGTGDLDYNDMVVVARQGIPNKSPSCSGPSEATIRVGQHFTTKFTGTDPNSDTLFISTTGLPEGAFLSVGDNGMGSSPFENIFTWTPTPADEGTTHSISVTYMDTDQASATCNFAISVKTDLSPVCEISNTLTDRACAGTITSLTLDGSSSYDPEGKALSFNWTSDCAMTSLLTPGNPTSTLNLTVPGTGVAQACTVFLTVSDGFKSSSCETPLSVQGCTLDCHFQAQGAAEIDRCGVCNGSNLCVDCSGTPFGGKTIDKCGVCGGNNACLDCGGTPHGNAKIDACGVCGGDNSSCVSCSEINQKGLLLLLEAAADTQAKYLRSIASKLHALSGGKNTRINKLVKNAKSNSLKLFAASSHIVNQLPVNTKSCSGATSCTSADVGSSNAALYRTNAHLLYRHSRNLTREFRNFNKVLVGVGLQKRAKRRFERAIGLVFGLNLTSTTC